MTTNCESLNPLLLQGMPFQPPETSLNGFFDSIENLWNKLWTSLTEFISGKTCRYYFYYTLHLQTIQFKF